MVELRYNNQTKLVTGWRGDSKRFGNLKREGHTVVILDIPIPRKSNNTYLFDEANQTLIPNPAYEEPLEPRDLQAEIDSLNTRIKVLENK